MIDERDEELENEEGSKKKKGSKMLLVIIIITIIIAAGGGGAFFYITKIGTDNDKAEKKENAEIEVGVMFSLEPFVVNLVDPRDARFLRISLQLELTNPAMAEQAKIRTPQIRNAIIMLLTSKSSDELISPEGKLQLKDEINIRINQALGENAVKNVFLTDFVMQ